MSETLEPSVSWSDPAAIPPSEPGPFQIPGFWIAWFVSGLAGAAVSALWSVPTIAIVDLDIASDSLASLSLSGSLGFLAGIVLSLRLGDRYPKRAAIRLCYFSMAACSVVAGIVSLTGIATIPLLYVTFVVVSVLYGLTTPLVWGLVAELMPRALLAKSIVMLSWSAVIAALLGLPLSILVFSKTLWDAPYEIAFVYVALLFVIAGLLTQRFPRNVGTGRFPGGFREAFGLLSRARRLRALWLHAIVVGGCLAVFSSSVALFAYLDLADGLELGWLLLARGGAGVVATFGLAFVISGRRGWPTLLLCSGVAAILCVSIAAADTFWPLLALMMPFGAASVAAGLGASAIAMSHTPFGYFGRIAALLAIGSAVSNVGFAFLSIMFGSWGQGRSLVVGAGVVLLVASLLLFRTWWATRDEANPVNGAAQTPSPGLIADITAPQKTAEPS